MPRTTPLASWTVIRTLFLVAMMLATAACARYQHRHKDAAGLEDSQDASQQTADASSAAFQPTSPFLHFDGANACVSPTQTDSIKNPFDLSHVSLEDKRLMAVAFSQIGTFYRFGGTAPTTGFDCSGFTCWVFKKLGVSLPRTSREQFQEGRSVRKSDLRKGDLVFFGNHRHITHVGIYLQDHKFIHSPSTGDTVKISSLDEPVWERMFAGARRVF